MNRRFKTVLENHGFNHEQVYNMQLIGSNNVRMANICIYGSYSVNGVAALHTEILKNIEMKDFYAVYPEKFNNKTNGITHRRWLLHINPELVSILDETIGTDWHKDLPKIKAFEAFAQDQKFRLKLKI